MSLITISVRDEASLRIGGAIDRVSDLTLANEIAGEYMIGQIDDRFRTETDPQQRPWQPLSANTLAEKIANGKITKILQRTGLMRSTVNYKATKRQLIVGLSSSYADKHQRGKGVPQRKILGVNRDDLLQLQEIYTNYVVEET